VVFGHILFVNQEAPCESGVVHRKIISLFCFSF